MNRIRYCVYALMGVLIFLSSCIKEDLSNCPPEGVSFRITYTYDATADAVDPADLQMATLFIFDENDCFVTSWELDKPVFNTVYKPDIQLAPGNYKFITWFNLVGSYTVQPGVSAFVAGKTIKSQEKFHLTIPANGEINEQATLLPLLLYGNKSEAIRANMNDPVVIPVVANTNRINITVSGLPKTSDEYRFEIKDDNGDYTFDNAFAPCDPFAYFVNTTYSATSVAMLSASLMVLKLATDRPHPVLTVLDKTTGETLFPNRAGVTSNLVELIQVVYPGNDFDKRHVYNIDILFTGTDVTVNGWKVNPSDNELTPD